MELGKSFCSGHGECHNGTCLCEIQFIGEECNSTNTSYFAAFATVFFMVALICLVQLIVCIVAEWQRLKSPSFLKACRITTQKLLYFVIFLASLIRGAYFTSPAAFEEGWSRSLSSAYYPLLLSGSSLIVCFWAEIFHLRDLSWEHRQFISKSFLGFLAFNFISYSLLIAEFITGKFFSHSPETEALYSHVFNGCYGTLFFVVVVFFLIYGVEVYFKVRGGFLSSEETLPASPIGDGKHLGQLETKSLFNNDKSSSMDSGNSCENEVGIDSSSRFDREGLSVSDKSWTLYGVGDSKEGNRVDHRNVVDKSQLHQSRLGLISQALMMTIVVLFLFSETLGQFWKSKVPIHGRNWHNLVFRVFEIGVALWFPCVLWNCMSPEELWILNPKRLLAKRDPIKNNINRLSSRNRRKACEELLSSTPSCSFSSFGASGERQETASLGSESGDCWICYDTSRTDVGPLIQPCECKGDVRMVHHGCLLKWLMERASSRKRSRYEGVSRTGAPSSSGGGGERKKFIRQGEEGGEVGGSKGWGGLRCGVCSTEYRLKLDGSGETPGGGGRRGGRHVDKLKYNYILLKRIMSSQSSLPKTLGLLSGASSSLGACFAVVQTAWDPVSKALLVGSALLVLYVCTRFFCQLQIEAYQRARVSILSIEGRPVGVEDGRPDDVQVGVHPVGKGGRGKETCEETNGQQRSMVDI